MEKVRKDCLSFGKIVKNLEKSLFSLTKLTLLQEAETVICMRQVEEFSQLYYEKLIVFSLQPMYC